eukprot:3089347-Prymnesium_polylepis.1
MVAREAATARAEGRLEVVSPRAHRLGIRADERAASRSRRAIGATLRHRAGSVKHAELDRVQLLVEPHHRPALRREPRRLRCRERLRRFRRRRCRRDAALCSTALGDWLRLVGPEQRHDIARKQRLAQPLDPRNTHP